MIRALYLHYEDNLYVFSNALHEALKLFVERSKYSTEVFLAIFVIDFFLCLSESVRAVICNAVIVITHRYINTNKESDTYIVAVLEFYFVGNEEQKNCRRALVSERNSRRRDTPLF